MATRKKGMKSIPGALSQAKDVFPICAIRTYMGVAIATGTALVAADNVGEVVDLNLQFEDNEVFDVWAVQVQVELELEDADVLTTVLVRSAVALYEDPDKATTTDIIPVDGLGTGVPAANFQDDEGLLHYYLKTHGIFEGVTHTSVDFPLSDYHMFTFPQPYTVARNLKWIWENLATLTASNLDALNFFGTIWGRRRNASDAEFKNIIYRQRF